MKLPTVLLATLLMMVAAVAHAESANVLKIDDGIFFAFDAESVVSVFCDYSKVETNSKTDNVRYTCHGTLDEGAKLPDKPMKVYTGYLDFDCAWDALYFQYILLPSGKYALKCQSWPYNNQEDY